jgi:hypothetical protein
MHEYAFIRTSIKFGRAEQIDSASYQSVSSRNTLLKVGGSYKFLLRTLPLSQVSM